MHIRQKTTTFAVVIELERHITKLLLNSDCVIIPDFGGFVAHHVDAFYDTEDNLFYPPLRTVGFNQQLKINDSMLVQSYVEALDISYPEALMLIEKDVADLKEQLERNGYYDLHDVGRLCVGSENNYIFEPCEAGILTPKLYGLSTYSINTIAIKDSEKPAISANQSIEKTEPVVVADANDSEDEEFESEKFTISYATLRYIAAACILAALFMLFPMSIGEDESYKMLKSKLDTGMILNIIPKDVMMRSDAKLSGSKQIAEKSSTAEKQVTEKAKLNADTIATKPLTYYTIVLASKVSHKNAVAFTTYLHKNGYEEAKILPMGKYDKVVYKQFETKSEANAMLNKITDNIEFADAWVTKIKE